MMNFDTYCSSNSQEINELLGEFGFPEDFIEGVWTVIEEEREKAAAKN